MGYRESPETASEKDVDYP